ncbi:MAG: hypothetical protein IT431_15235 [Phycisphaerales bacterium]|nr:hypothetical protein [Phycisphaerales bacterium]
MVTCRVDAALDRVRMGDMSFPLGAYPVEAMDPAPGYTVLFEPADGDNEGEWEEWPDRYVFDIVISAERVEALVRHLLTLLPGRVYPILDILGHDAYREVDPYVSYELVGLDRFTDIVRRFRGFFFEDGLVGFGAMSDDPFIYLFVDEHKIVTLRCLMEQREQVEAILRAFDLEEVEKPAGADSALHEHRSVLVSPAEEEDVLGFEEILEELRDRWQLMLNIDPESNVDDDGNDLGVTDWRLLARAEYEEEPVVRYVEVFLRATCLAEAEELGREAGDGLFDEEDREPTVAAMVEIDRVGPKEFRSMLTQAGAKKPRIPPGSGVVFARWAG